MERLAGWLAEREKPVERFRATAFFFVAVGPHLNAQSEDLVERE